MIEDRSRIIIIGAGISGLAAAHLLSRKHQVTLIEKEARIGGNAHTIKVSDTADSELCIDLGFSVFNDQHYPAFRSFLKELNVAYQPLALSLGYRDQDTNFCYSTENSAGWFSRWQNIFSPRFWRMLIDIYRLNDMLHRFPSDLPFSDESVQHFLDNHQFSSEFIRDYLIPLSAAIRSPAMALPDSYSAVALWRMLQHFGTRQKSPTQWFSITNGSQVYLNAFEQQFKGTLIRQNPAVSVTRYDDKVEINLADHSVLTADYVILATPAHHALELLTDPGIDEKRLLAKWEYSATQMELHTDTRLLPDHTQASWNILRNQNTPLCVSYHMNRLQRLHTRQDYIVTRNPGNRIDARCRVAEHVFEEPIFTCKAMQTQARLSLLNNFRRTFYCGSYFGSGTHEDGVKSAEAAAAYFNLTF